MIKKVITLVFLISVFTYAKAQDFKTGKYILSFEKPELTDNFFTFSFNKDNTISMFFPDDESNYQIGKWERQDRTMILKFNDYQFRNFSGTFYILYKPNDLTIFAYRGCDIYLLPFEKEEFAENNRSLGITGVWETALDDGTKVIYNFKLPNTVEVTTIPGDGEEQIQDNLFWQFMPSSHRLVMFPEMMLPNTGPFEKIELQNDLLGLKMFGVNEPYIFHKLNSNSKPPMPPNQDNLYLVTIIEKGVGIVKESLLMQLDKEGIIQIIGVDKKPEIPFAKIKSADNITEVEFIPIFSEFDGSFTKTYFPQNNFMLKSERVELHFTPYELGEIDRIEMGIYGKWFWEEGDNKLILSFEFPDIVTVTMTKGHHSTTTSNYWYTHINGEDVGITSVILSNNFSGSLRNIKVIEGVLHFDHDGTHYEMIKE